MGVTMATEAWCDECQTEPKGSMLCEGCADRKISEARDEWERDADLQNCDRCDDRPADCCDSCASEGTADVVREWAQRRKMLGLLSLECFAEFELCISDIEAGDA